jgi:septation ring formation regulator EzrA
MDIKTSEVEVISLPVDYRFYINKFNDKLTALYLMTDTVPELIQEFKREIDARQCCDNLNRANYYLKLAYIKQEQ